MGLCIFIVSDIATFITRGEALAVSEVTSLKHLVGTRLRNLTPCLVVTGGCESKTEQVVLKQLLMEQQICIDEKGKDTEFIRNPVELIIVVTKEVPPTITKFLDDRRYKILKEML